jgi:hypothetical protein
MATMTLEKATREANRLNRYVKDPKISYETLEIRPKFSPYDDEGDLLTPQYRVVQKYDGNIVWYV